MNGDAAFSSVSFPPIGESPSLSFSVPSTFFSVSLLPTSLSQGFTGADDFAAFLADLGAFGVFSWFVTRGVLGVLGALPALPPSSAAVVVLPAKSFFFTEDQTAAAEFLPLRPSFFASWS